MRLPRFKIRCLLGLIFFIAIAIAALRAADDLWDSGILGLTLLTLLTATLLAVHRIDRRRAYWLGFALFGWVYLVASLIPPIWSRLPTTKGLTFIDSMIPGRDTTTSAVFAYTSNYNPVRPGGFTLPGYTVPTSIQGGAWIWDLTTGKWVPGPADTTENFIRIGHSLVALVLAFVGGRMSLHLYGQGRGESMPSPRDLSTST